MRRFTDVTELEAAVGSELGVSKWHTVTQAQIDQFAEVTGDSQWIHVDSARATDGPFGSTIAHGYLTLSLIGLLSREIYRVGNVRMAINYGLDKVRFPAPLPVDARVRGRATLASVTETGRGLLAKVVITVERDGSPKPVCVAETLALYVPEG